jgi:hypothetical protein
MTKINEGVITGGEVIVEEINPITKEVVSREVGHNVICVAGATSLAWTLENFGSAGPSFNFMVLSTDAAPAARASTSIAPQTAVSHAIVPTLVGSILTWENTFPSGGSAVIAKFGMQQKPTGGAMLWNEYVFSALKDNDPNDLKVTYNASFAP